MIHNLKIVKIDANYCDYLRKFDSRVPYNFDNKNTRPFVGVLFKINNCEYFAPLSSPKLKHLKMKDNIDFLKIDGGKLGAVNFNNMIPVTENNYVLIDFSSKCDNLSEIKYRKLLKEQLDWLNSHNIQVKNKSSKLYNLYICNKLHYTIKDRCCNFKLLEDKCNEFNKILVRN